MNYYQGKNSDREFNQFSSMLRISTGVGCFQLKCDSILRRWLVLALISLIVFAQPSWSAGQDLTGLRQGRVHIQAEGMGEHLTVQYTPIYGWNEPLLFYGPDARLLRKEFLGHRESGQLTLNLDQGPGHYVLILKPSYIWQVSLSRGKMVYQPPAEETGLRIKFNKKALYFKVPQGTPSFDLFWVNHRSFKGSPARIQIFNPHDKLVAEQNAPKINPETLLKNIGIQSTDKDMGAFNPESNPVPPKKIHFESPTPGLWKVIIGTTGINKADDVGLWFAGISSYFTQNREKIFAPDFKSQKISAKIKVSDQILPKPLLGVVGSFGPKGGKREKIMSKYGIQAEKVFLNHNIEEPRNDNPYDMKTQTGSFRFAQQNKRLFSRVDQFSLVVLHRWADWMKRLSKPRWVLEWSEWANVSVEHMMQKRKMNPSQMAVQFLNEPNLEMHLSHYIQLLKSAGSRIKNNPKTEKCQIAAPAVTTALSKYDTDTHNFLSLRWIRHVLEEADDIVDVIVFNVYGVRELEDTFLYTKLVDQVSQLVTSINSDEYIEPIIIGATNRAGGLAAPILFNEWEGGLWWASVLAQVINTGKIKAIYYFNLIDKGIRQKGLFTEKREPKNQALIQQLYNYVLTNGTLYKTESDHQGIEAITVKTKQDLTMILVNKSWLDIKATIQIPVGKVKRLKKIEIHQGAQPVGQKQPNGSTSLELPSQTVTFLKMEIL